jgi:hypothetical protein
MCRRAAADGALLALAVDAAGLDARKILKRSILAVDLPARVENLDRLLGHAAVVAILRDCDIGRDDPRV